jgi:hypothetical protein
MRLWCIKEPINYSFALSSMYIISRVKTKHRQAFQIAGKFCDAVSLSNWPGCEGWCGWWWPEQSCSPSIWTQYKCLHHSLPTFKGTMSLNANKQSLIHLFWFKSITTNGSINNKTSHSPCLLHFFQVNYLDGLQGREGTSTSCHVSFEQK